MEKISVYFTLATREMREVTKKTFKIWQEIIHLGFVKAGHINNNVQWNDLTYRGCQGEIKCSFKFDGLGGISALAFSPTGRLC